MRTDPPSSARRVLSFTGTRSAFLDYLDAWLTAVANDGRSLADEISPDEYEWELTASIARHPAGKGLSSGE